LLAHGRWFSPASFTTNTGRHDIAEILLKVALNTINQIKSIRRKKILKGAILGHSISFFDNDQIDLSATT
jgi:hypothetical protein